MQYLFKDWPHLSQVFKKASRILLLADFDGTLASIVDRPELAEMSLKMRMLLANLAEKPHFTVGILSGRSLSDLKKKAGIEGIAYAGNHGFEIETSNDVYVHPKALGISKFLNEVGDELKTSLSSFKGVFVENKGLTLSIHYRLAPLEDVPKINKIFSNTVGHCLEKSILKKTVGKKVLELRPPIDWNKGSAILWLIEKLGLKNELPIYLGDDKTDEDAFCVLKNKGISIFVGEPLISSKAAYYLRDTLEVEDFLEKLGALFIK
ncbi:MAG TPA: trehalose-phosphatase [Actinobacteria bacterium]|nr:trehalose-phosphatase [Actinomycetota bacterium]